MGKKISYLLMVLFIGCFTFNCTLDKNQLVSVNPSAVQELKPAPGNVIGYVDGIAVECQVKNGQLIYQGDIVASDQPPADINRGTSRSTGLWPDPVPYNYVSGFDDLDHLKAAIAYYNAIGIRWVPRNGEKDYIRFRNGDVSCSYKGKQGGKQYIDIYPGDSKGIIMHEMAHALGMHHEQCRADRDEYIKIDFDNIKPESKSDYAVHGDYPNSLDFYNFDWKSIMLYSSGQGAKDKTKPVWTKLNGEEVKKQREGLSLADIGTLYTEYPPDFGTVWTFPVSRRSDIIDIFAIGSAGNIKTSAWHESLGGWQEMWQVQNGVSFPGSPITAVARSENNLDLFVLGRDQSVYTAAWNPADGWKGWWKINTLWNYPSCRIAALSRGPNMLDIFTVDARGRVMGAAWSGTIANGQWQGWWRISDGLAAAGTRVEAVAPSSDKMYLFIVGDNGNVQFSVWKLSTGWSTWYELDLNAPKNIANLTAIASSDIEINLFAVTFDGRVYSVDSMWGWGDWKRVGDLVVSPGTKVAAVSRKSGFVDIFAKDNSGKVYTAAWEYGRDSRNTFRGWWQIDSGAKAGTQVSAVSRNADHLAVFHVENKNEIHQATWTPAGGWQTGIAIP